MLLEDGEPELEAEFAQRGVVIDALQTLIEAIHESDK